MPATVDKELLLRRFLRAAADQSSIARGRVVKGVNHAIEQAEARDVVVGEIVAFLGLKHRVYTIAHPMICLRLVERPTLCSLAFRIEDRMD